MKFIFPKYVIIVFILVSSLGILVILTNIQNGTSNSTTQDKYSQIHLIEMFSENTFTNLVDFRTAHDGSPYIYVVEQSGIIKVINTKTNESSIFLDITAKVLCCGERGLLSLAFHPDFSENNYFFVHYSAKPDGRTVIARYTTTSQTSANISSEFIILTVDQPYSNHNGGQIFFGLDDFVVTDVNKRVNLMFQ